MGPATLDASSASRGSPESRPNVALVCRPDQFGGLARRALEAAGWTVMPPMGTTADAHAVVRIVLAIDALNETAVTEAKLMRAALPSVPFSMIIPRNAELLRELLALHPDDVIWSDVPLGATVLGQTLNVASRVATELSSLGRAPHDPPSLLAYVLRSDTAIETVYELARALGVHRTTLDRRWRRALDGDRRPQLRTALQWAALARALGHGRSGAENSTPARLRALRAHSKRLLGLSFSELTRLPPEAAADCLRSFLLRTGVISSTERTSLSHHVRT